MTDERRQARRFPIQSGPSIPWAAIEPHEDQARRNHGQSLEHLAERGGLSPCEAVAVMESRRWEPMDGAAAVSRLRELAAPFEAAAIEVRELREVLREIIESGGERGYDSARRVAALDRAYRLLGMVKP